MAQKVSVQRHQRRRATQQKRLSVRFSPCVPDFHRRV